MVQKGSLLHVVLNNTTWCTTNRRCSTAPYNQRAAKECSAGTCAAWRYVMTTQVNSRAVSGPYKALVYLLGSALVSCSPSGTGNYSAQQAKQRQISEDYDRAVIAARGWKGSSLDFLAPGSERSPEAAVSQMEPSSATVLGPFRLGMTVEEVRRRARAANLLTNGGSGRKGWCKAPLSKGSGIGIVIAPPTGQYHEICVPHSACARYSLNYSPVGSNLRLTSVEYNGDKKTNKINIGEVDLHAVPPHFHETPLVECDLTNYEYDQAERHETFESSILQDILSNPLFRKNSLPFVIQETAQKWEDSKRVLPKAMCCDIYSRNAIFNGGWHTDGVFVLSYDVSIGGLVSHDDPYLIVIDPKGRLRWNGYPGDFKKAGLRSKQTVLS